MTIVSSIPIRLNSLITLPLLSSVELPNLMEKTSKGIRKYHNDRVDRSQVKILMCFHCGEQFSSSSSYQRHLTYEHQALSLCYQIYQNEIIFEKNAKKKIAKESRRTKGDYKPRKLDPNPKPEGVSYRRATDSKLELSYKRTNDAIKEKNDAKRSKVSSEVYKKIEKNPLRNFVDIRLPEKRPAPSSETEPAMKRAKEDVPVYKSYISDPCHEKCNVCEVSYEDKSGESLVDHYVSEHGALINTMNVHLYKDKNFVKTRNSPAGTVCLICDLKKIDTTTEYFHHLIQTHLDMLVDKMSKQGEIDSLVIEMELSLSNGAVVPIKILIRTLKNAL
ncbi:unnamed protein product [Auanema sp. JU1783]|nr:unnamed protein product [Auanema sp. JU1783]